MLSRSTWKYLKNIRSYKYQNDEKGQRALIEKMSEISVLFVSISIVRTLYSADCLSQSRRLPLLQVVSNRKWMKKRKKCYGFKWLR